jgi:hypothetical protein
MQENQAREKLESIWSKKVEMSQMNYLEKIHKEKDKMN